MQAVPERYLKRFTPAMACLVIALYGWTDAPAVLIATPLLPCTLRIFGLAEPVPVAGLRDR